MIFIREIWDIKADENLNYDKNHHIWLKTIHRNNLEKKERVGILKKGVDGVVISIDEVKVKLRL